MSADIHREFLYFTKLHHQPNAVYLCPLIKKQGSMSDVALVYNHYNSSVCTRVCLQLFNKSVRAAGIMNKLPVWCRGVLNIAGAARKLADTLFLDLKRTFRYITQY